MKKLRQAYAVGLVSEALGHPLVHHEWRFGFLRGDPTPRYPRGTMLPVDAYFPGLNLVVEVREPQHYTDHKRYSWWNSKMTATGVSRQHQRAIYDRRREEVLPRHGITVLEIRDDELPGPPEVDARIVRDKLRSHGFETV